LPAQAWVGCVSLRLGAGGCAVRYSNATRPRAPRSGYRLRIDETRAALRRCLPDDLLLLFRATTNPPYSPRGVVFDHRLEQVASFGDAVEVTERCG